MELQEFIKTALTEIVVGVAEASDAAASLGGSVGTMKLYGYVKETKRPPAKAGGFYRRAQRTKSPPIAAPGSLKTQPVSEITQ